MNCQLMLAPKGIGKYNWKCVFVPHLGSLLGLCFIFFLMFFFSPNTRFMLDFFHVGFLLDLAMQAASGTTLCLLICIFVCQRRVLSV